MGSTTVAITGAESYCNIKAVDLQGKAGMIMGIAYADATKATNCSVGGKIALKEIEGEDANGDKEMLPEWYILDNTYEAYTDTLGHGKDYWYKYIYADEIAEDVATAAGCSLLAEKPALPTYIPAN